MRGSFADSHQAVLGLFHRTLIAVSAGPEYANARDYLSSFLRSPKIFIDRRSLPGETFAVACDFGDQLSQFKLGSLPFDEVSLLWGPIADDEEDAVLNGEDWYNCVFFRQTDRGITARVFTAVTEQGITRNDATIFIPAGVTRDTALDRCEVQMDYQQDDFAPYVEVVTKLAVAGYVLVLGAMNCDGSALAESGKAPKFINAKRESKGKPPLYSYHVLEVDLDRLKAPGHVLAGGSHASPRLHWRRGHVRELASGKAVMVRPCLVGDCSAGFVGKDYRVSSQQKTIEA